MEGFDTKHLYIGVLQVDNCSFQPYSAAVNKCYDGRLYSLKNSVSKQFSRGKHICVFVISQINSLKYRLYTLFQHTSPIHLEACQCIHISLCNDGKTPLLCSICAH